MIQNDYIDFNVSEHYMSAIINGDYSGLTDQEESDLNRFLSTANLYDNARWDIDDLQYQDSRFTLCDVSDYVSNCFNVKLHFFNDSI